MSSAAETHFALHVYGALLRLMQEAARYCSGLDAALERWPFLDAYLGELAARGLEGMSLGQADAAWPARIAAFEEDAEGHLPLRALGEAFGLSFDQRLSIAACLWAETEPRLGALLEALQGLEGEARFTGALLARLAGGEADVRALVDAGLVEARQPDAPFGLRGMRVPERLASALIGRAPSRDDAPWACRPADDLPELADLVVPDALRAELVGAAALFARGDLDVLSLRGPPHNGRRTLARALARVMGRAALEGRLSSPTDTEALAGGEALAAALGATTILDVQPGVGETLVVPAWAWRRGPLVLVLPPHGGVDVQGDARRLDLAHDLPERGEREALWRRSLGDASELDPDALARRWRMSCGAIGRAARGAQVSAAVAGRSAVAIEDLAAARRMLGREALDTLATPVPPEAGWSSVVAPEATRSELVMLEARCRHREALGEQMFRGGRGRAAGVRALFKGVSGTGKSLAASALAGALGMDLYRVDLATVTSKFVGETEKNLDKVLSAAEALDVILLIDEGDALLGARTTTHSANDRFANLETNFLLQRLEALQAILIVTTNAPENIDQAFSRRMDVSVDFPPPGPEERAAIWRLHLPPAHEAPQRWVDELAWRCAMTGGQIRNAVMHAALLALDAGRPIVADHLTEAVEREYRKAGQVCPLRRMSLVRAE